MNIDCEKIWYSKNLLSTALLPLSWLFRAVVAVRRIYYRLHNSTLGKTAAFVIVVGNITVGGTGKTPFVIWLAQRCKAKGLRIGIVTRGYKRDNEIQIVEVEPNSLPTEVGDEAIMLALKTACPVIVAAKRRQAVDMLANKYKVDAVLSDDGLQHYDLPRNVEIALVDGERQFGNGRCLPAGPLREPVTRLNACDLIVSNGSDVSNPYHFEIIYTDAISLASDTIRKSLNDFKDFTVHAVAGIENPARFFNMLRNAGLHVLEHRFPDHHTYQETDLEFNSNDPILMTEKDAVKCKKFAGKDIWYVPISLLPSNALEKRISSLIEGIPHG